MCLVCVYVYAAPLFVADDQSLSPKASRGGTADVFVCVTVCLPVFGAQRTASCIATMHALKAAFDLDSND